MNLHKYLQTDSRWGGLPYPKAPWYIRNCGCGEVSVLHAIIEMVKYKNYTPATIQPYMKRFAEARGNGTYHYGIPEALRHYGCTDVKEHATLNSLWKELTKGPDYIVIYLMGSARGGSKRVKWTGCGHFVESCDYEKKNGKHYVYMKDSASNSNLRNGKISYEENFRGSVLKVWSGKLPSKIDVASVPGMLVVDGIGGTETVKATQEFFKTHQNGVIAGQDSRQSQFYPSLKAVRYSKKKKEQGNDPTVIALQKWVGVKEHDGILGKGTIAAWQKKLKDAKYYTGIIDGYFGVVSMEAWQNFLNDKLYPTPKKITKKKTEKSPGGNSEKKSSTKKKKESVSAATKIVKYAKNEAKKPKLHYVRFNGDDKQTWKCPYCSKVDPKKDYEHYGSNCIWGAWHCLFHGAGIEIPCNAYVFTNENYEYIATADREKALKYVRDKLKNDNFTIVRAGKGKNVPKKKWKPGDIGVIFRGNKYLHTFLVIDDEHIFDCVSTGSAENQVAIRNSDSYTARVLFRYTGK